jgi:hypothetical protein
MVVWANLEFGRTYIHVPSEQDPVDINIEVSKIFLMLSNRAGL